MSQGFYVHVTANTNITATETNKTASTQAYLKNTSQNPLSLLRVNMNGGPYNFGEESVIYFDPSSSTNFDNEFDAYKMAGQDPYAPFMALENGTDLLQINGIPQVSGTYTTYLKTLTGYNGTYSITSSENSLPIGACINLFDRFTLTSTDLATSDYVFNLSDTTTVARFILSITLNTLQVTSNVNQPTCQDNIGEIIAVGNSAGPWNYYWKDGQGNPLQTTLNKTTADTLQGLVNGAIQLEVTTTGGCDNNTSTFSIIGKVNPTALFSSVDTCYLNLDPIIVFHNQSSNLVSQIWDFGDSNTSNTYAPHHQYQSIGNYSVTLIVNSATGCIDSVSRNIVVANKPVGVITLSANDDELIVRTLTNNKYIIEQDLKTSCDLSYSVKDIQGKLILQKNKEIVNEVNLEIDLSNYQTGIYFLSIQLDEKVKTVKLTVIR